MRRLLENHVEEAALTWVAALGYETKHGADLAAGQPDAERRDPGYRDLVLFVNGLALAVMELKNAADENASIWSAFHQFQTYQNQIPALFAANAALVISDGVQARIGTLASGREWFKPWRTISGRIDAPA